MTRLQALVDRALGDDVLSDVVLAWCEALPRAGSVRGHDRMVGRHS